MYRLAMSLTPASIESISRVAFRELHRAGIRTVGEFHYIHHQADGTPYGDRTMLSDAMIRIAREEGLRVSLLRVAYHRAGPGRAAEPGQRRFCDANVDDVLRDVDRLRARWSKDPDVRIGIAPHSVRAVPPAWLAPLAEHAKKYGMPFHMHVAEQEREIHECIAETGKRPVELLADLGVLGDRFVAVHATNVMPHEARLLGEARAFACVCATTERDLGDGLPDLGSLRQHGVTLCTGIDSHVITDPIDDLRALETHERLRTKTRVTFQGSTSPAEQLWLEGSKNGSKACGFDEGVDARGASSPPSEDEGPTIEIDETHPTLALVEKENLLDAIVFSGHPGIVKS
jgi:formiminoglutamate deiminase